MADKCEVKAQVVSAIPKPKLKLKGPRVPKVGGMSKGGSKVLGPIATSLFPSGYGFVVLTAVGSIMMVTWKSMKVGIARDEFKVPYPQMYTADNMAFNCVLRAHQNTMETYPQFLLLLMIGGLEMPYFCSLGGLIWILGRIYYAKGYYTGDPSKRARGTFSIVGMLMLLGATAKFALTHLTS